MSTDALKNEQMVRKLFERTVLQMRADDARRQQLGGHPLPAPSTIPIIREKEVKYVYSTKMALVTLTLGYYAVFIAPKMHLYKN
jgi:hypothetical protein